MEPLLRSMQCETLSACRKGAVGLPGSAALGGGGVIPPRDRV